MNYYSAHVQICLNGEYYKWKPTLHTIRNTARKTETGETSTFFQYSTSEAQKNKNNSACINPNNRDR